MRRIKRFKAAVPMFMMVLLLASIASLWMVTISSVPPVHAWSVNVDPSDDTYTHAAIPDTACEYVQSCRQMFIGYYGGAERIYIKFNLWGALPEGTIGHAELSMYAFKLYGSPAGLDAIEVHAMRDDSWSETTLTWNIAQASYPAEEVIAPAIAVTSSGVWYKWDVTSYVREQVNSDNLVSFVLVTLSENTQSRSVNFSDKDGPCSTPPNGPYLNIMRAEHAVNVSVPPQDQVKSAITGQTITFPIIVKNLGFMPPSDTYDLTIGETGHWGATVSPTSLTLPPYENAQATVSVTLPSSAVGYDTISVTATCRASPTTTDSEKLYAVAGILPTDDSQVTENTPDSNNGGASYFFVASNTTGYKNERSFMKFDLSGISITPDIKVRLNLYAYVAGGNVQCRKVENDDWSEMAITWRNPPHPDGGTNVLDTVNVNNANNWYTWDVTNWAQSQYSGDKVLSLGLRTEVENLSGIAVWSAAFDSKEAAFTASLTDVHDKRPYLSFIPPYMVDVSIPSALLYQKYQENAPGGQLTYTFSVTNIGGESDFYYLSCPDNQFWTLELSKNQTGTISPGGSENVYLTVTIPEGVTPCTLDGITVIAASHANPTVTDSEQCVAHAFLGIKPAPVADTYVNDNFPGTNYGTAKNLYQIGRKFDNWENAFLKFDISGISEDLTIQKAELWMWCYVGGTYPYGMTDLYLEACRVDDDSWSENAVTWNNPPSGIGAVPLDTAHVTAEGTWYKWDVTNFVLEQRGLDNLVSLCVRPRADTPISKSASFDSKEYDYSAAWPRLKILCSVPEVHGVKVGISPSTQDNIPGGTLKYTVTVTNTGNVTDTYTLGKSDNATWTLSLPSSIGPIANGSSGNVTLTVTIPSGATPCTKDNITVTATGTGVSAENSCIAHAVAPTRSVDVSIPITSKSGLRGSTITYTVAVKNTGTVSDTYTLENTDNASWTKSLSKASVGPLAGGASENVTLSVTVPDNAPEGTRDNITVRATSTENTAVKDNASCIAQAILENRRGVQVSISPGSQDGENGGTLTYTVTATNTGNVTETYDLSKTDTRSWTLTLQSSVTVPFGETSQVTLTVGIPAAAENNTSDSITVTATSSENTAIENSATCVARCIKGAPPITGKGVLVTIDSASKSGAPGEVINFSVTVTNTGTATDTFTLTVTDNENWGPTLSIPSTTLAAGGSRTGIKLSITIPSDAADEASTTITVTATGTGYDNDASCTATATAPPSGTSPLIYVGAAVVVIVIIVAVFVIKPF